MTKKILLPVLAAALFVAPGLAQAEAGNGQLVLPGLFGAGIDANAAKIEIEKAARLAPWDAAFNKELGKTNPKLDNETWERLNAENFIKKGGYQVVSGPELVQVLRDTFFYSSAFQRMNSETIYANLERGISIDASNIGSRQGFATVMVNIVEPISGDAEATKANAISVAESIAQALRDAGIEETAVEARRVYTEAFQGKLTQSTRIDITMTRPATVELAAATIEKAIEMLPKPSASEAKRVERSVRHSERSSRAKIDVEKAARAAGRK